MEIFIADFALKLSARAAVNSDLVSLQVESVLKILPAKFAVICQLSIHKNRLVYQPHCHKASNDLELGVSES